ncbi:MAG: protein DA1 [Spirochaetia bacterium]
MTKRKPEKICGACGKPVSGEYIISESIPYHTECFYKHKAKYCSLCGKVINGRYLADSWGNIYHDYHKKEKPQCDYCGRFLSKALTGGGTIYPDGRAICGTCIQTAVSEHNEGMNILIDVYNRLEDYGIGFSKFKPKLFLLNRSKLKSVSKDRNEKHGYAKLDRRIVNRKLEDFAISIYILKGMPYYYYFSTCAHELMHVWQYLNAPLDNSLALKEGSCQMASYLVLKDEKSEYAEYLIKKMMQAKDKVYGEGFRRVREYVKKNSVPRWLTYLKKERKLPGKFLGIF